MDAINLLTGITLPAAFGAPAVPLQPGQVVQALVLELLQSGAVRLQLPQAVVDVRADVPLIPGATVTLAVKGSGAGQRLVILASDGAAQAGAPPEIAAASHAARRPIGEAIVISRMPVPDARAAPAPIAARDAPSITPQRPVETVAAAGTTIATPARALADAVQTAAARQGGLAPLFADAEHAVKTAALPEPVRAAAAQLLQLRVPLDGPLTASVVKQALTRSGVLLEPRLAAAASMPAAEAAPPVDLKAAMLVLRQALKAWVAEAPSTPAPAAALVSAKPEAVPVSPASAAPRPLASAMLPPEASNASAPLSAEDAVNVAKSIASALLAKAAAPATLSASPGAPPPPYRGAPLVAQPPVPAGIIDMAPRETAERLIAQTDAALARQTLLQAASLPDAASLDTPRSEPQGPRWTFEVPFSTPQGTGIVPFEIARDGHAAPADKQAPAWRVRFSLDIEPIGPVHALVVLTGERVAVTLCAERLSTAAQLNDSAPLLGDALRAAELQPSELAFRVGTPRAAKPAAPGRFMDRAS